MNRSELLQKAKSKRKRGGERDFEGRRRRQSVGMCVIEERECAGKISGAGVCDEVRVWAKRTKRQHARVILCAVDPATPKHKQHDMSQSHHVKITFVTTRRRSCKNAVNY
jgi:hypothetical protein